MVRPAPLLFAFHMDAIVGSLVSFGVIESKTVVDSLSRTEPHAHMTGRPFFFGVGALASTAVGVVGQQAEGLEVIPTILGRPKGIVAG